MAHFLVERTIAGLEREQVTAMQRALLLAARGTGVRYARTTWLPGEGRCLCLFESAAGDDVRRVNDVGQVPWGRIVAAVDLPARTHALGSRWAGIRPS
jgi:hypothetical protein